jgi:hypothetical protein
VGSAAWQVEAEGLQQQVIAAVTAWGRHHTSQHSTDHITLKGWETSPLLLLLVLLPGLCGGGCCSAWLLWVLLSGRRAHVLLLLLLLQRRQLLLGSC